MKNFRTGKIIVAIVIALATVLLAVTMLATKQGNFIFKNKNKVNNLASNVSVIKTDKFDLTNVEVIKKASELLGKQYKFGQKGYNGNIYSNTYNSSKLYEAKDIGNTSEFPTNHDGIDCSGLVYWTLSSLAKEKGWSTPITTGFSYNNPVPVDCMHWLTYGKSANTARYWGEIENGNKLIDTVNPTFNGKVINVLKKNDEAKSEDASSGLTYYQYKDENGNVKNLPSGTIIVSYNKGNSSKDYDHAWIYIGNLGTSDPNQAKAILEGMGITGLEVGKTIKQNGNSTHWRIEAAGGVGVYINNAVLASGTSENGKTIGNIWAFQVASEISGKYEIEVLKEDLSGKPITSGYEFKIKDINNKELGTNKYGANISKTDSITLKIEESKTPQGYTKVDNFEVNIGFKYSVEKSAYILDANNIKLNNNAENIKLDINENENKIIIKVPNKTRDLALKKIITHINNVQVDSQKVRHINEFTTTLNNGNNNAEYEMNKTPINVKVGDTVTYELKIYNEGETDGFASKIRDYIPVGLKLLNISYPNGNKQLVNGTDYNYNETNNYVDITIQNLQTIKAYDKQTLSSDTIVVNCEVVEGATGILTNIAEITEYTFNNEKINIDIDSKADNWVAPAKDAQSQPQEPTTADKSAETWKNYANGKQDYLDNQFHKEFVAQEHSVNNLQGDDDDFEKLLVLTDYKFTIKKVNANNEPLQGIDFSIARWSDEADVISGTTNEQGIIIDNKPQVINTNKNETVKYYISEVTNNQINNIVQLDDDIILSLEFVKGKLHEYEFIYGNQKVVTSETKTFECETKNGITLDVTIEFNKENNDVKVIIENKYLVDGNYAIRMKKTSTQKDKTLQGVVFSGTKTEYKQVGNSYEKVGQDTEITFNATDANGLTNIIQSAINTNNYSYKDVYVINEISLGNNTTYTKMETDIILSVYKKRNGLNYELDYYEVTCGNYTYSSKGTKQSIVIEENGVSFNVTFGTTEIDNIPVIDIAVTNAPEEIVKLWINKKSYEDNSVIAGTKYNVFVNDIEIFKWSDLDGCLELTQNIEPGNSAMQIKVIEREAAEGYENVLENKYILLNVEITQSVPTLVVANVYNEDDTINTELNNYISASIVDTEDGSGKRIDLTIKNPVDEKVVDLALKKVITEINGIELDENSNLESKYNRLETNKCTIDVSPLQNGKEDAIYNLNKTPILLPVGAKVKYQLRVYNESSEIDATASKIKDYIPQGLKLLNVYYQNEQTPLNEGSEYTFNKTNNVLNISVLDKKPLIDKFVSLGGTLDVDYVTVECQIEENATGILTNVAEITEYKTENGFITEDRDSKSSNWENPNDGNSKNNITTDKNTYNWSNYTGNEENEYEESVYKNYLGQEDDDDFEKVIVANVDLVLKKVITKINDTDVNSLDAKYHRLENGKINVNYNQLDNNDEITTAEYYMNKTPINVKINDEVTYELRVYNEGNIDATASKITDYIPKGMDLVSVYKNNTKLTQGVDYTIDENNVLTITALKGQLIEKHLKGQDIYYNNNIKVTCKVNGQVRGLLSNVAEITQYETKYGEINVDIDSQINNWEAEEGSNKLTLEGKAGSTWARYKFADIITGKFKDYKGQQDDDDFEKVRVLGGYSVNIKKVSARDNSAGLENVELDVNGTKYTTDENGECNLGQFEIDTQNSLSVITINEIVAQNDKYVKLKNPITIGIMSKETEDGSIQVYGYRINCVEPNLENASEVFISKALDKYGNIVALPQYLSKDTNIYTDVVNFYAEDENGNNVRIMLNVAPDKENDSNVIFNIQIENDIKDNFYELFIKKVDEKGIAIDGVKFKVSGTFNKEIETKDGETNVVHIPINSKNYEIQDVYKIEEISTLYNYLNLDDELYLLVNKGINDAKDSYELKSISLTCNGVKTAENTEVELKNIKTEGNKTVNVTAKIKDNKIIVTIPNISKEFDLALRKFITKVNGKDIENSRIPVVNISKLDNGETTAEYSKVLDPVLVRNSDIVTYTIRVYNEGELDGYATRIMDDIPEGLQMVKPAILEDGTENLNAKYKWKMYRKFNQETDENSNASIGIYNNVKYIETDKVEEAVFIVSEYLSKDNGRINEQTGVNSNLIKASDVQGVRILDYRDVQVDFKVIEPSSSKRIIENKAQITDDKDSQANQVIDRDSTPNVWEESPRNDDQDIEKIEIFEEVKENNYELYIKKVDENGKTLDGTKFNISGNGISDNLGKSNIEVETKGGNALVVNSLINSDNYQVKDVYTIEEIATLEDYFELKEKLQLSVNKGINVENNCYEIKSISLKCNNVETKEGTEAELKDVKVYKDKVVNIKAKIEGNKIIVTVPNIRKVFDLALYKWVSSTMVIEDNKVTEYASEHTQDDKSKLVNVTIPEKELDKTVVKFKYVIKVENQGNVDGYAKEIKDHIPEGLKFVTEDNKNYGWVEKEDGVIVTDYLKDTLLEKGETAEVEVVLTWVSSKDNLGMKWNYAEISKDYNEFGTPDVDSKPDNFNGDIAEDDEDKDVVMLNVRTGSVMLVYIGLGLLVVAILAVGVVGVKKVLNRV